MPIPTIKTARLRLRAFTLQDWEPYAGMYADERFFRYPEGMALSKGVG